MNLSHALSCVLLAALLWSSTAFAAGRHDGSYLHDMSREHVTPHLDWASQLPGEPVRATFIVPREYAAREVIELVQRFDLHDRTVATNAAVRLAHESIYEAAVTGTSEHEKTEELLAALKQPSDVIVLANYDFNALPTEAKYRILRQTADGAGLVITYPRRHPYKKIFAQPIDAAAEITALAVLAGLPEPVQTYRPEQLVKTYRLGEGRVVVLDYPGVHSAVYGGLGLSVLEPYSPQWQAHYENNLVLVAKALLWAAGRSPGVTIHAPTLASEPTFALDAAEQTIPLVLEGRDALATGLLKARLRRADNTIIHEAEQTLSFTQGHTETSISLPPCAAGSYYLDLRFESDAGTEAFGYVPFQIASPLSGIELATDRASYPPDQPVAVTVAAGAAAVSDLTLRVQVADLPYHRVWARQEAVLRKGEQAVSVKLELPHVPTLAAAVVAELWDGNRLIERAQHTIFFPQRQLETYPRYLWGSLPEYLTPLVAERVVDDLGWRAGLGHPTPGGTNARLAALFDQRFVPYMTRIGLAAGEHGHTVSKHWLGLTAKEVEAAVGDDQSFYNPAAQALWKKAIDKRIENLPTYGPMVYNLGDENYFSYDAGYSPSDEKAYRAFLEQRYGTIAHLNAQWGTSYADFASVEHAQPAALRENANFPAWFDHRLFMEQQYADLHHFLANYIRSIDPEALVGAEGSVPGNLELTISQLDFWGPYSDPVMDELLRSIGGDKLRTLWWGGYTGSHGGRDNYPFPLWRPLLQGAVNGSAWYTGSISTEGFFAIDLTYADYYKALRPHLDALRRGLAQLLITQPLQRHGIAVLWSHASDSASHMDERFFSPRDSITALMSVCYRQGLTFDLIPTSKVEAGGLAGYRLLLLAGASALSEQEVAQIEAFTRQGGIVIADLNPGVLNAYCKPLQRSAFASLLGESAAKLNWQPELTLQPVEVDAELNGQRIRFRAAKAWQSPAVDTFIAHPLGKGLVLLLNFNLGSASNTAAQDTPFEPFVLDLLALAKIQSTVSVAGMSGDRPMVRIRQSDTYRTVGILMEKQDVGQPITFALDRPGYVYRADIGPVGQGATWQATLDSPFALFCVFDEEQAPPRVTLDRASCAPGEHAMLQVSQLTPEGIYRLEMIAPDGQPMHRRMRVLSGDDLTSDLAVRFAYTDAPGRYTLRLADVRTGLHSDLPIDVHADGKGSR